MEKATIRPEDLIYLAGATNSFIQWPVKVRIFQPMISQLNPLNSDHPGSVVLGR